MRTYINPIIKEIFILIIHYVDFKNELIELPYKSIQNHDRLTNNSINEQFSVGIKFVNLSVIVSCF